MSTTISGPIVENIPAEMRATPRWVVWKYGMTKDGKETKFPYRSDHGGLAASDNPETWSTFDEAMTAFDTGNYAGIGFCLGDGWSGIDLDDCISEGDNEMTWGAEIVAEFATYAEYSPSGTGQKIFLKGTKPAGVGCSKKGFGPDGIGKLEVYDAGRYFTVTGNVVEGKPIAVNDCTQQLADLCAKYLSKDKPNTNGIARTAGRFVDPSRAFKRAKGYIDKLPASISGELGSNSLLQAACECLRFGLSDADALTLLIDYNTRAVPPWDQRDLERKISEAHKKVAGPDFGSRLAESDQAPRPAVNGHKPSPKQNTPPPEFPLTDAGNAERIMHRHGDKLRFVARWKKPLVFDGIKNEVDECGKADQLALETMRDLKHRGAIMVESDDDTLHALGMKYIKWAHACESHRKLKDMLSRAEKVPGASIMPDELDTDPWLLNFENGTLNLKTFELQPHRRDNYITKVCPLKYDPDATAPDFLAYLDRIFEANDRLISFVQRAIGYTLTGITTERVLFILFGGGANGKSTLLGIIRDMMGTYATQTAADTLMVKRHEGIPNDIARLCGARYVSATESDEGRCLAEGLVKRMTGGEDVLTGRFMFAEFFDFKPTFKLWLGTNHRPVIRGNDPAIWDRLKLIPFNVRIPEKDRDKDLSNKLRAELPGIMAWAVRGLQDWQQHGLGVPDEVTRATTDYKDEMDRLADFVADSCEVDPRCSVFASELYDRYKIWCALNGEDAMNQTKFGRQLQDRGFNSERDSNTGKKIRLGIELK